MNPLRTRAALGLALLAAPLWLAGCPTTPAFECDADNPCALGATCLDGQCVEARCSTSAQCPMEQHCANRECVAGCAADNDCFPGNHCDRETSTCVADGCTDTSVDCSYREFCNQATGDCYDAGDNYCKFCNEDAECGEGNLCLAHYCGVDCSGGKACPSGFECYPFADDFGNVVAFQCFTYCWLYDEDYVPAADGTPPVDLPGGPGVVALPGCETAEVQP